MTVTARGLYGGEVIVVKVRRYGGGFDENDDWQDGEITFARDGGAEITFQDALSATHRDDQSNASIGGEDLVYFDRLVMAARERYEKARHAYCYNPRFNSIEAYWLAFNCGDGFDDVPEIEVDGDIGTFGSPFSDEDMSGVIF